MLQGLTLKPLLRAIKLRDDDPVSRELTAARQRALRAGLETFEHEQSPAAIAMRKELTMRLARGGPEGSVSRQSAHAGMRLTALQAAREAVLAMRAKL